MRNPISYTIGFDDLFRSGPGTLHIEQKNFVIDEIVSQISLSFVGKSISKADVDILFNDSRQRWIPNTGEKTQSVGINIPVEVGGEVYSGDALVVIKPPLDANYDGQNNATDNIINNKGGSFKLYAVFEDGTMTELASFNPLIPSKSTEQYCIEYNTTVFDDQTGFALKATSNI
ncbi:MAG: hypothetical protein JEY91_10610 [Spirochaetaceae bacterium]|nr:hypothetical protein [Spirochaetaceae bacterium]